MKKNTLKGAARLIEAFRNSKNGCQDIWKREEAFRQEFFLLALGAFVAIWISSSLAHFGFLVGSILILMIVEILNSAIEATIDRIGLEHHELSRIAKDLGSLAVLLTSLIPLSVWLASLFQYVRGLFT